MEFVVNLWTDGNNITQNIPLVASRLLFLDHSAVLELPECADNAQIEELVFRVVAEVP